MHFLPVSGVRRHSLIKRGTILLIYRLTDLPPDSSTMHKNVSRPKSTAFQLQTQVRHTQRNYDSNASVVLALGDRHAVSKVMKHPKANSALIRQRSIFEAWQTWRSSELVDILSYFFFFAINLFFSFSPFSFFLFNGFWGSLVYQYPNFFCRRIVLVRFVWASVLASKVILLY